jgi:hypothetical protein
MEIFWLQIGIQRYWKYKVQMKFLKGAEKCFFLENSVIDDFKEL